MSLDLSCNGKCVAWKHYASAQDCCMWFLWKLYFHCIGNILLSMEASSDRNHEESSEAKAAASSSRCGSGSDSVLLYRATRLPNESNEYACTAYLNLLLHHAARPDGMRWCRIIISDKLKPRVYESNTRISALSSLKNPFRAWFKCQLCTRHKITNVAL